MLSFMRMFRGTFHMMLLRLNASSHAIVIDDVRPSPRPAVWSVRRPPPNKNTGNNISAHRRAGDNRDPLLERIVERLQVGPELPDRIVEGPAVVGVDRRLQRRDVLPCAVQALDHRVVVLVQPIELVLLDSDGGAEAGVPLFRMADTGLDPLQLEDHVAQVREADLRRGLRGRLPRGLEPVSEELHLLVDLDSQQVVRGADVLPPPVAGVPRDSELDLLQEPAVGLDAFTDVGDVVPSRLSFLNRWVVFRRISTFSWYSHGVHCARVTRGKPTGARRRSPCSRFRR